MIKPLKHVWLLLAAITGLLVLGAVVYIIFYAVLAVFIGTPTLTNLQLLGYGILFYVSYFIYKLSKRQYLNNRKTNNKKKKIEKLRNSLAGPTKSRHKFYIIKNHFLLFIISGFLAIAFISQLLPLKNRGGSIASSQGSTEATLREEYQEFTDKYESENLYTQKPFFESYYTHGCFPDARLVLKDTCRFYYEEYYVLEGTDQDNLKKLVQHLQDQGYDSDHISYYLGNQKGLEKDLEQSRFIDMDFKHPNSPVRKSIQLGVKSFYGNDIPTTAIGENDRIYKLTAVKSMH